MIETGVIHGRFQVLHNDHLKYLLAGKSECRHLVVGITNPDPILTRRDPSDPQRSASDSNPLTYYERYKMVHAALLDAGVAYSDFAIVPFPINFPALYVHYVPLDATFFLTIYDSWGKKKMAQFQNLGLKTKILWEKPIEEKGLQAADIRRRMARGQPWETMVPASTEVLMKKWDIPGRLKKLAQVK